MKEKKLKEKIFTVGKSRAPYSETVKVKTETGGYGVVKSLVVFLIIAVQLAFWVYIGISFAFAFKWAIVVSFLLSLITCIYVLSSNKNSLSKAVWIIFLLLFFYFGHIIYLISDERIFFKRARKRFDGIYKNSDVYLDCQNKITGVSKTVNRDLEYLYSSGKFKAYNDTSVRYFSSGTLYWDDIIEKLKQAKKFIFIEFFIISDGALLERILSILKEKAKNGVNIRIIYDDMGSRKALSGKTKKRIKNLGVKLYSFNRLKPIFSVALNYRDHRKMIIIDGETAYTGGCNLADEYVNEKRLHGYWKDSGVRLDGKSVDGFTVMFLRQWEYLSKEREDYSAFLNLYSQVENSSAVVPYADGLDYRFPIGKSVYENMISSATEKIYIMTPYFIPDDTLTNLLINKAVSGVDVRILLPEIPDKKLVYGVTRNNAEKLIDYGVKVYCMKHSFVHSKVMLTENSAVVGSINMDLRSFYQQFECAIYTDDKTAMKEIEKDFDNSFILSMLISDNNKKRKSFLYRALGGLMQLFAPFF